MEIVPNLATASFQQELGKEGVVPKGLLYVTNIHLTASPA